MKDLSYALSLSLHQLTGVQFADKLKGLLTACPACGFAGLVAGQTYLALSYEQWRGAAVYHIHATTPKRQQITVSRPGVAPGEFKLYAGSHYSTKFHRLDEKTQTFIGVDHEQVVRHAHESKLAIPPRVRREYPTLFLDCPDRFSAEEFVKLVKPNWSRIAGAEELDRLIADKKKEIDHLNADRNAAFVVCRESIQDYDEYLHQARRVIELCRWLAPNVSPGGIFYVEQE